MQTDLITKVYFNEHLTHSCVGMPQGLQALLSSYYHGTEQQLIYQPTSRQNYDDDEKQPQPLLVKIDFSHDFY